MLQESNSMMALGRLTKLQKGVFMYNIAVYFSFALWPATFDDVFLFLSLYTGCQSLWVISDPVLLKQQNSLSSCLLQSHSFYF